MANIVRMTPFGDFVTMQNLIDRVFEDTVRPTRAAMQAAASNLALDVDETETGFVVTTTLPGVAAEDIKINVQDKVLTIEAETAERLAENEGETGTRALLRERTWGKFSRSIRLPKSIKTDAVEADFENGVLTLTLPKAEHVLPRSIPVKVGNGASHN